MTRRVSHCWDAMMGTGGPDLTYDQVSIFAEETYADMNKLAKRAGIVVCGSLVIAFISYWYGYDTVAKDLCIYAISIAAAVVVIWLILMWAIQKRLERANENAFIAAGGGWNDRSP